ncbi:MAG: hypothetical protein ACRC28_12360 [Clostridium sp.]|uniref:hypothetical protein n=1 Tax=Clostridium sp. TaxID=1506 RepID=UPI003F376E87
MKKKSHCNCNCHSKKLTSEDMIHPVPLSSLKSNCSSCNCSNEPLNKEKDGTFIDYNNTSFSNKSPVAYGEEADSDDL